MLKEIGHDGSEIIYPDLPEPRCRRAFHIQECLEVLDRRGYAATPFYAISDLETDESHKTELDFSIDFENHLNRADGVLTGQGLHNRHAVAWIDGKVYDPNGLVYDLIDKINSKEYIPDTFWKIKSF